MDRRTFLKIMGLSATAIAAPSLALAATKSTPKGIQDGSRHIASIPLFVIENYKKETGKDLMQDQEAMREFLALRKEFNV